MVDVVRTSASCCGKSSTAWWQTLAPGDYDRLSVMLQWRYAMETGAVRTARKFQSAAARGQRRGAHGAARGTAPVNVALLEELVQVAFSASAASCCATPWAAGWEERQFTGPSTPNAAPKVPVDEYVALAQQA